MKSYAPDKFGMSDSKKAAMACNHFLVHYFLYGGRLKYKHYVSPQLKNKKKREKEARKRFYRAQRQGKISRQ